MSTVWFWVALMCLGLPIAYGWGHRGWGPPLPRALQHRRALKAKASGTTHRDHHAWGIGGDVLWALLIMWMIWTLSTIFWHVGPWGR